MGKRSALKKKVPYESRSVQEDDMLVVYEVINQKRMCVCVFIQGGELMAKLIQIKKLVKKKSILEACNFFVNSPVFLK